MHFIRSVLLCSSVCGVPLNHESKTEDTVNVRASSLVVGSVAGNVNARHSDLSQERPCCVAGRATSGRAYS
jgi:hypothetical protein